MDTKKLINDLKNKGFSPIDSMKKVERERRADEFLKDLYGPYITENGKRLKDILINFQKFHKL